MNELLWQYIALKGEGSIMQESYQRIKKRRCGRVRGRSLLFALSVSLGVFLIAVTAIALLVSNHRIALDQCKLPAGLCYGAAVFAGCCFAAHSATEGKLLRSVLIAALCFLLLQGGLWAMPGTHTSATGKLFAITAAAWAVSRLLGARKKRKRYGL